MLLQLYTALSCLLVFSSARATRLSTSTVTNTSTAVATTVSSISLTTTTPSSTVPSTSTILSTIVTGTYGFEECSDVYEAGNTSPGSYVIKAYENRELTVWCDQGWTSIQRRKYADESFDRPWAEYVSGFGDVSRDFWSGLEAMHSLTRDRQHRLRFEFLLDDNTGMYYQRSHNDADGTVKIIELALFSVGPGESYRLTVNGLTTNLVEKARYASFLENYLHGSSFSTRDKDQDNSSNNCAEHHRSGWWYHNRGCSYINFNVKNNGMCTHDNEICAYIVGYRAKSVEMKIRR